MLHFLIVSPPFTKQTANGVASREEEEISELQEDDRDQFSDQLASVGMLGRIAAEHCMPLLTRYTQSRKPRGEMLCVHSSLNFKHPHPVSQHTGSNGQKHVMIAFVGNTVGAQALWHR